MLTRAVDYQHRSAEAALWEFGRTAMLLTKILISFNLLLLVAARSVEEAGQTFGVGRNVERMDAPAAEESLDDFHLLLMADGHAIALDARPSK